VPGPARLVGDDQGVAGTARGQSLAQPCSLPIESGRVRVPLAVPLAAPWVFEGSWHHCSVTGIYFDARIAERYETYWPELFEPAVVEPAVSFLAELAGTGAALELGIGTGRLAVPLSQRGVRVHGIEISPAMVAQLRGKPGAEDIDVTVGNFATTRVSGTFKVAYLVRNTIMNLTTQDEQVECFRSVASHLDPGGCFVIEVVVPELQRLPPGETVRAFTVTPTHLGFDELDVGTQGLVSHHYWVIDGQFETWSSPFRYVWPSELDLMARLAGMRLRERWSDWSRAPFTSDSRQHVSVWEKTA
jgi:SAM-dependent methyltransferase